jgi:hypothetical protein
VSLKRELLTGAAVSAAALAGAFLFDILTYWGTH